MDKYLPDDFTAANLRSTASKVLQDNDEAFYKEWIPKLMQDIVGQVKVGRQQITYVDKHVDYKLLRVAKELCDTNRGFYLYVKDDIEERPHHVLSWKEKATPLPHGNDIPK